MVESHLKRLEDAWSGRFKYETPTSNRIMREPMQVSDLDWTCSAVTVRAVLEIRTDNSILR